MTPVKNKTAIIYAPNAVLAAALAAVSPVRSEKRNIRVVSLEEFRGETESDASAVAVIRKPDDERIFDAIQSVYPMLEVASLDGVPVFEAEVREAQVFSSGAANAVLVAMRLELVNLGGTVPAGADEAQLADLIAAQRASAAVARAPVFPQPGSATTVIPDATPVAQRQPDDATGVAGGSTTSQPVAEAVGAANGSQAPGAFSPPAAGSEAADVSGIRTHEAADKAAAAAGVDVSSLSTVAEKVAAVQAARL